MKPTTYRRSPRASSLSYGLPIASLVLLSAAATWSGCGSGEALDLPTDREAQLGIIGPPGDEVCDGFDNDQDGDIDEDDPDVGTACNSGQLGICAAGTYVCEY